jgi:hypothetical protein
MMDGEVPWKLAKEDAVSDWNATQRYDMESAPVTGGDDGGS